MLSFERLRARLGHSTHLRVIVRGAGLVMAIRVAGAGAAFLSQILLARWMGPFDFGIYVYAWVFVRFLAVPATLGLHIAMLRFIPEYKARKNWRLLRGVIRFAQRWVLLTGLLIGGVGVLVIHAFTGTIADHYVVPLTVAMGIVPIYALLNLYQDLSRGFGWAVLAFAPTNVIWQVCLVCAIGILIVVGTNITSQIVLGIAAGCCLVALIGQAAIYERRMGVAIPEVRPVYRRAEWLRVSGPLLLIAGFYLTLEITDLIMLGAILAPDKVGTYSAAVRIAAILTFIYISIGALAVPRWSALYAKGGHRELQSVVTGSIRWTFWPSVALALVLLLMGKFVLGLFGPSFVAGYLALVILIAGHLARAATAYVEDLLMVTGHQLACLMALAGVVCLNIMLNAVLIPIYGITGAAISTAFAMAINALWQFTIARRRLRISAFVFSRASSHG